MAAGHPYQHLLMESRGGGVTMVTLNRPERLNAMSTQTRRELAAAFRQLNEDAETGAVVLIGAGDRAFSAGQDLSESKQFTSAATGEWEDSWNQVYHAMRDFEKPIVAAVHGYAVGGACHITLLCDIRIGTEKGRFGVPEVDDGIPRINGTMFLCEFIGRGRAVELVLTGRMIDAQKALDYGILSRLVPAHSLLEIALEEARMLAAKPRTAIRLDKRWLRQLLIDKLAVSYAFGKGAQAEAFKSGHAQQAMGDFLAKRSRGRST